MKLIEKEFNVTTGEETVTERNETADETKERLAYAKEVATEQAKAEARATARAEILNRLGLSAEEAKILLG